MTVATDLVRLTELDDAWQVRGSGARLAALRRAGRRLRDRILARGTARSVRTVDIATFPYPAELGLQGAASSPVPFVFLRRRMHLVQVESEGHTRSILVNPTDAERSMAAPFFAHTENRYGRLARRLLGTIHTSIPAALSTWGIAPSEIDYVTFDHLHTQDVRSLLAPGASGVAFLPNAKLLVQGGELDTLAALHPLQREWYIPDALAGIPADKIVALDGDYALGGGFALVRTPGHTLGHHTLVVVTARGAWTISGNGICVDAYVPGISRIRGLARHARDTGTEVIPNASARESSLDQYTSMVLEKTLADTIPERPELPQCFSSSALVPHPLAPGLSPTYSYDEITFGTLEECGAPDRLRSPARAPAT